MGWSGRISLTLSRPLKDRLYLERNKEGIQWYHNINKNAETELAQNMQGIGENLFKLKPTIHWLAVKEKNVSIRWNHQWRTLNVSDYKYAQNLISPLGLANLFLGGGEFVVSFFIFFFLESCINDPFRYARVKQEHLGETWESDKYI